MNRLVITYGTDAPGMAARYEGDDFNAFMTSSAWRIRMLWAASKAESAARDLIVFSPEMNYRDCLKVLDSLRRGEAYGVSVIEDVSFTDYISACQTYIDERAEVGLAIKRQDPKVEEAFTVFSDTVQSLMERPLREKQMRDAFFMASMKWSANFSVPGSGKTASVLGMFAFLHAQDKVDRVLVICPKNAFDSWRREWLACFGALLPMNCFCIGDPEVASKPVDIKRMKLAFDTGTCNLLLLNYEAIGNYVVEVNDIVRERTLLVFDEVHRIKAIGGQRATNAMKASLGAKYCVVLTGTPIPNTYMDIYNFLHILYPEDYDAFFGFGRGDLYKPDQNTVEVINSRLRPFFCRTNKDELGVPRPNPDLIDSVPASIEEDRLLHILVRAYRGGSLGLYIRILQLESDAALLREKIDPADLEFVLDQVGDDIDDIDFVDYSEEVSGLIADCPRSTKRAACVDRVAELAFQGKSIMVWCIFVKSISNIVNDLHDLGISAEAVYGATPQNERDELLESFRRGEFQVLVTNPHTLAESVSLHQVCHDSVYFEYSYNLVHLLQSKDRINRLGLPDGQYTQYQFMRSEFDLDGRPYSLDEKIYDRLVEKEEVMREAIDGDYLENGFLDSEDLEIVLGELFSG